MKLKLPDGDLTYDRSGNGLPILFIHGYPLSRKIWEPQMIGLADIASVLALDLRGHGDSNAFTGLYSMDLLADDCKFFLDSIKINYPIVICGLSMGGYVTMAFYRRYPQLVAGMILTSTRPGPDSQESKANRDKAIQNANKNGARFIADSMIQKMVSPKTITSNPALVNNIYEIMVSTSIPGIIGDLQAMKERPDSTSTLARIDFPVLIIHGADDQLIPPSEAEGMHAIIKNSQLVVLNDAAHLLNLEQPEKYNQAVRRYISALH